MHDSGLAIAVIDDGINESLYNTGELVNNIVIDSRLNIFERNSYDKFADSHGTTCAGIIRNFASDAELISIKILGDNLKGTKEQLIAAIRWCIDNQVKIINLSLGSIGFEDFLDIRAVVNEAYYKGIIIVAAYNNDNIISLPASLSNAIGVKAIKNNACEEGQYFFAAAPLDGIEIAGTSCSSIKRFDGSYKYPPVCNSYTAPMITAKVYTLIKNNPGISFKEILFRLARGAKNSEDIKFTNSASIDWIEKALVFNMGRNELYDYKLAFFDIQNVLLIENKQLEQCLDEIIEYCFRNLDKLNCIDTLIFVNEKKDILENGKKILVNQFFKKVNSLGKNIVLIGKGWSDESIYDYLHQMDERVWSEHYNAWSRAVSFNENIVKHNEFKEELPAILVYGNNEKLVLKYLCRIRDKFINNGFRAIACTDNSIGVIYGFRSIKLNEENQIKFEIRAEGERFEADIIMYGLASKNLYDLSLIEKSYDFDMKIDIYAYDNKLTINIITKEEKIILQNDNEEQIDCQIDDLYSKIIYLYSKEN